MDYIQVKKEPTIIGTMRLEIASDEIPPVVITGDVIKVDLDEEYAYPEPWPGLQRKATWAAAINGIGHVTRAVPDKTRWGDCPWHETPCRDDGGCDVCAAEFGDADAYRL